MTTQTSRPEPKRLFIKTYGCQMNVYDSERMRDVLRPLGYQPVDTADNADLVVLNTCHIREKATEKVYSELGQIKKLKEAAGGKMTIAVAGCVAQAEGAEIMRRQPAVDLVLGPQAYHKLPEMVARASRAVGERLETEFETLEKFDALPKAREADGPTAFLSVQEGCDKFCTFCVVPYTRGAELSRPVDDITLEARSLAAQGVREVTLLGQNVNAWHGAAPKLEGGEEWGLGKLARHLARIGGFDRIRYTTSHPRDMDDDLIAAHAEVPQLMPFLHLPVQSGSDRILKAMNRGHTAEHYLDIMRKMRDARPDMALASDFIVGFPGESDQDFEDTMSLVREVGYAIAYSFKYSARPGTPAADMFGHVPEEVKDERLQRLQALLRDQQASFNASKIGETIPVLVTGKGRNPGQLHGRSPWMQAVHFDAPESLMGQIVDVKVAGATLNSLAGEYVAAVEVA
ncbi:tRNA (N6-isopentenyl adenosine(37)-C2)-methylthiotransferase MiaB [Henriciella mobilis]|uniref:tRNA (N6-isopentenyl adenosine(37)-C2)-methylthiotransferase MiaB n=1 Tax=Henriciella mobilis TaxID=2305467 RepID=UPI000E671C53|nr:tRNA (N6-isopentenyl adenosine(37)-C2)-methylthiotransferase MiaB [Henriciella mobilis]RIJ18183.1 tRNA (N6-isopentenyl adenosine(37)-C2)-methylthiotransferase MiaB [Henriciella mobilis]RIJ25011.1 tRNA (N6-isopentenyl adenosine(37)-C2)-methylthiotransferase MiaB [Henriciella mobilis]